jgi:hypothetical protein
VIDSTALRQEAFAVAAERLRRARPLLGSVAPEERAAIEAAAMGVAFGVADALLDAASRDPVIAEALAACYPAASEDRIDVRRQLLRA